MTGVLLHYKPLIFLLDCVIWGWNLNHLLTRGENGVFTQKLPIRHENNYIIYFWGKMVKFKDKLWRSNGYK